MTNKTRNNLLADIAAATGVSGDLKGLTRNELMLKIAEFYGGAFTSDTMLPLLRYIDGALSSSTVEKLNRNQHLKNICSSLLGSDAPSGLTRNQYLQIWLDNIGVLPESGDFTNEFTNEFS